MADSGSSTSAFVSSLIFNLIIFAIFIGIFILLRNKYANVYRPRTTNKLLPAHLRSPPLAHSAFAWFPDLVSRPAKFFIQHTGIDGYFYLRYLMLWANVGLFSGLILWPVLFAINATGGGNKSGFDIISYSNNTHKWRVFAHLFCSWLFFGFVVYCIYSELVYYTGFRHSLQCTAFYNSLPSSKVLLLDNVPEDLLEEENLKRLFPAASNITITRDTKEAREAFEKRTKLQGKLEGAFHKVISKCIGIKRKTEKKLEKGKDVEVPNPPNQIVSYIKEEKLPKYSYKPIIGKKKNVFNDGIEEFNDFNLKIEENKKSIAESSDSLEKVGTVLLQFSEHLELQRAYQAIDGIESMRKSRKFQGFFPNEIIWKNAGLGFAARKSKRSGAQAFLTLMIIFWAIPVAVVGCISNINYLTEKVHFLRFINNMPDVLMGIITGILPSVLLSILMSLVPPIIKWMGKLGGCITVQQLDFWTQQWFFGFQVIQVFIVTTGTSAASSVVTSIIDDPSQAMMMLSEQLPPASNFYISYMLLQGLSISSGMLAQITGLILSFIIGRVFDKTPRQKWNRDIQLSSPSWGVMYGSFGLFTVIMLCYAIIAPIIIVFTSIAFILIAIAQMYSLVYVSGHTVDNRGRNYPLALFEVFVGVYLAEICLIGLFVMQKNWPCVVLESVWLALTVLAHLYLRRQFEPVLDTVPLGVINGAYAQKDLGRAEIIEVGQNYLNEDSNSNGYDNNTLKANEDYSENTSNRKQDEYSETKKAESLGGTLEKSNTHSTKVDNSLNEPYHEMNSSLNKTSGFEVQNKEGVEPMENLQGLPDGSKLGMREAIKRFFKPKNYTDYSFYKPFMPDFWDYPISKQLTCDLDYQPPEIGDSKRPILWIARDELGLSSEIKSICKSYNVDCEDSDAVYNDKGKVTLLPDAFPPGYEATIMY
ncbi:hypothetical protein CANINC_004515 [Pichia inconspicua]|uniref:Phosphate metabolism protein 7 n=1 Tax=Pichia inconspicua TaxID=52247 RepID=A0A4T0WVR2_9ASCO|nr:hypothetical protein CANINC_004515 [[Candida] inconspicua]